MLIVVEDDDGVRVLVEELLLDRGYSVITAPTGAEGLDRIRRAPRWSSVLTRETLLFTTPRKRKVQQR